MVRLCGALHTKPKGGGGVGVDGRPVIPHHAVTAMYTIANGHAIWSKNIQGDTVFVARVEAMRAGDQVDLEVAGVVGKWERMRDGHDGRRTSGLKPVGEMRDAWNRMLAKLRGTRIEIREVIAADSYLAALAPLLSEWESPEDEAAFRDL